MSKEKVEIIDASQAHTNEEYRVVRSLFDPSNALTDEQIGLFLQIAKEKKLSPINRQICARPSWNSQTQRNELVVITQIDGYRLIAERTGCYAPGKEVVYKYKEGKLISATAFVKKMTRDGTWHEIGAEAFLAEYMPRKAPYIWQNMPHVMLAKCAEAMALRKAFPGELSGLYVSEEMDQADEKPNKAPQIEKADATKVETIDFETGQNIEEFINGDDYLLSMVLQLTRTTSIYDIKKNQVDAVRSFAKAHKKSKRIKEQHEATSESK